MDPRIKKSQVKSLSFHVSLAMSKLEVDPNATPVSTAAYSGARRTSRKESVDDFSPEWCQKILNDPAYQHSGHQTRIVDGPNGRSYNSLMGKTLFTDHTLRAMKVLYKPADHQRGTTSEVIAIVSLGDEMCSHPNVLHGGVNTTIIDEVGGGLAMRESPESLMAVNFNVNLRKAVKTPGIVLVEAWFERPPEGRKMWVKCSIEQDGVTCIESEALYLKLNTKGKL